MSQRRRDLLYVLLVAGGLTAFAWIVITMQNLSSQVRIANAARDALARQVQSLGHTPVAGPPGSRGLPGQSVTGPQGPQGIAGSPGPSGAPGTNGSVGTPGEAGPTGAAGAPGTDGAQGPAGAAGPQGEQGPKGDTGDTGPQGAAGPAPSSWTWTDPLGITYTCVPDSDGSTRYTCATGGGPAQPTPGPTTTAALDPRRKH